MVGLAFSRINLLLGLAVRDPESAGLAVTIPATIARYRHGTSPRPGPGRRGSAGGSRVRR